MFIFVANFMDFVSRIRAETVTSLVQSIKNQIKKF